MNDVIAEIKRDYIYELAKRSERADGRALDEYRPIQVEVGLIGKAEGSARVKIGNTQVLVGVKVQPGEPFPDSPDTGVIITNVELVHWHLRPLNRVHPMRTRLSSHACGSRRSRIWGH